MKGQILNKLRAEKGIISGETLSAELNISRVSIWKHIQKLKKLGYEIDAAPTGYRLVSSPDTPFPWEFPERSSKIHYYEETTSTMDMARDLGRKGCPDFTIVVADRQTKGRGRLSRTWISEDGGLYFSIILRPDVPPVLSFKVNFAASTALAKILRDMFKINASVKWPNDILVENAKLSGMLSELEAETDRVSFINLGIGINVNNNPAPKEQKATSLKNLLGSNQSRKEILANFLDEFEACLKNIAVENIISRWKQYVSTLGQHVKVTTLHDAFEGVAEDVDDNGALILRLKEGGIKKILYGDCFYQTA
jgi:BirA family biotin operon repressor/biotin-[acetyl-CoA-carboxylase] ligase